MASTLFRRALRSNSLSPQSLVESSFRQQSLATSFRRFASEQPRLRIGSSAPNFKAKTTIGDIDFHDWKQGSWAVLFSHPADFTPVCTTELGAFARFKDEWEAKNIKMIGLSTNDLGSHDEWLADIKDISSNQVNFPLIADLDRKIAFLYDMVDEKDVGKSNADGGMVMTIRSVFIVDPNNKIRLTMQYPASTGRNTAEVDRVLDALLTHEKHNIATPINWTPGQDVIVPVPVSTEDAKKKFGEVKVAKPYLRYVSLKD